MRNIEVPLYHYPSQHFILIFLELKSTKYTTATRKIIQNMLHFIYEILPASDNKNQKRLFSLSRHSSSNQHLVLEKMCWLLTPAFIIAFQLLTSISVVKEEPDISLANHSDRCIHEEISILLRGWSVSPRENLEKKHFWFEKCQRSWLEESKTDDSW